MMTDRADERQSHEMPLSHVQCAGYERGEVRIRQEDGARTATTHRAALYAAAIPAL